MKGSMIASINAALKILKGRGEGPNVCGDAVHSRPDGRAHPENTRRLAVPFGTRVQVVDPNGIPLPSRRIGEIVVRLEYGMRSWDCPEAIALCLGSGWRRTGDVGFVDDDGRVFVVEPAVPDGSAAERAPGNEPSSLG